MATLNMAGIVGVPRRVTGALVLGSIAVEFIGKDRRNGCGCAVRGNRSQYASLCTVDGLRDRGHGLRLLEWDRSGAHERGLII
jgi:hypothetical protein